MVALIILGCYVVTGLVLSPRIARWELARIKRIDPHAYPYHLEGKSEQDLIHLAGQNTIGLACAWPYPVLHWLATRYILRDFEAEKLAAKIRHDNIENRRIIAAHKAAELEAFDAQLFQGKNAYP